MKEEDENKELTATEKAIAMLSEDNRKWLESWVRDGWQIEITADYEWLAAKSFEENEAIVTLEGYQSIVLLLSGIEAEEYRRKTPSSAESEIPESATLDENSACLGCAEAVPTQGRFCDDCVNERIRFQVPTEGEFLDAGADFMLAPEVAKIAERLIRQYPEDFWAVKNASIDYLWKRKGGGSHGRNTLGKLKKVSGELKFYSQKDYVCVLSADHCLFFNHFQITALTFHELKHAVWDHELGKFELVGHDFEGFRREVELFGYWKPDIGDMAKSFQMVEQGSLFETAKSHR